MKKIVLLFLLVALSSMAEAGEIFGKITEGAVTVGENASVEMKCGAKAYPATKTDKTGTFHVVVSEAGKCSLTVGYKGQKASVDVVSFDDAVQADLVLEMKDGKLAVRRK